MPFMVMMFGTLNDVTPSPMPNVRHCKRTPSTIAKQKSFQGEQNGVFLFLVMLVIGVLPKVQQLSYTNFGFVMILELLCWRHWEKVCNWKARGAFFMAYVGYNIFHPR
jgi:hypothetical protein